MKLNLAPSGVTLNCFNLLLAACTGGRSDGNMAIGTAREHYTFCFYRPFAPDGALPDLIYPN